MTTTEATTESNKSMSIWDHIELCYNLTIELFSYLRNGTTQWLLMLIRLILFTFILTPAWINLLYYWFFSEYVVRNISYSSFASHNRNLLDIYLPEDTNDKSNTENNEKKRKVIIFFSGGAWVIGYKLWVATCAYVYTQLGYIVVAPDYRNFPQGDAEDMVVDCRAAVEWTVANIESYGGDSSRIILAGQSAGAQISLCMLIQEYKKSKTKVRNRKNSSVKQKNLSSSFLSHISMYVGISGPYNLESLGNHLNRRGLPSSLLEGIFRHDLITYSPTAMLAELVHGTWSYTDTPHATPAQKSADVSESTWRESMSPLQPSKTTHSTTLSKAVSAKLADFPPVLLYHGMRDNTIPYRQCSELGDVLRAGGAYVRVVLVPEWSHTDSILESPLAGDASMASDIDHYFSLISRDISAQSSSTNRSWLPTKVIDTLFSKSVVSQSTKKDKECSTPVKSQKHTYSVQPPTTNEPSSTITSNEYEFSGSVIGIPPARVKHSFTENWVVQLAKPFNPF